MDKGRSGVDVCVGLDSLKSAPMCPHGPTLLFEHYTVGSHVPRKFYACSACRNSRECDFFQWADDMSKCRQQVQNNNKKTAISHIKYFQKLKLFRKRKRSDRHFCQSCSDLLDNEHVALHKSHVLKLKLTRQQLRKPTRLLRPLEDNRNNAQYLFSESTVQFLVNAIQKLKKRRVLCVGAPRLFEEIIAYNASSNTDKIDCLLLDIDHRLLKFLSPRQVCHYNMFNHHFFEGSSSRNIYMEFLRGQTPSPTSSPVVLNDLSETDFLVVIDPPFGGLIEVIAFTLKRITEDFCQVNEVHTSESIIPVFWIFPYFMERRMVSSVPLLSMLDYQVEYDNHDDFRRSSAGGIKNGSPVRIFTNIDPAKVILPEDDGYWFCSYCRRYCSAENRHCSYCNACTTKAGPTYVHCNKCQRCVKSTWQHCNTCKTCELSGRHTQSLKKTGCHICGAFGHKRQQCPSRKDPSTRRANFVNDR